MVIAEGNNRYLSSIEKRSHRYIADLRRDSPAICRPQEGYIQKFVYHAVLPASKTTAVGNLQVLSRFEQRTTGTRYCVFCCVSTLIQAGYMQSCLAAQKRFLMFKGLDFYSIKRYRSTFSEFSKIKLSPKSLF
jgi:hypothetical protein